MNESYFNVSHNNQFMFRTEWDDNPDRLDRVEELLSERFRKVDGYVISIYTRSKERLTIDVIN